MSYTSTAAKNRIKDTQNYATRFKSNRKEGRQIAIYAGAGPQDTLVAKLQVLQCNITRDVLANIETQRSVATDKHCFFLAKVLGVSIDELFRP